MWGLFKISFWLLLLPARALVFVEFTGDFRVRNMLEDMAREEGPRWDFRQPLSLQILKGLVIIWGKVCSSVSEEALFHAALLLVFLADHQAVVHFLAGLSPPESSGGGLGAWELAPVSQGSGLFFRL